MTTRVTAQLSRSDAGTPWGFRIAGGRDFGAPVTVQRVVPGGVAERAGIIAGDKLVDISGSQVSEMCHRDAQMAIRNSGNSLKLEIDRDNSAPTSPSAVAPIPSSSVTNELRNLEIRGTNYNPEEADSGRSAVNTTAQPWRSRKSIDASSGVSPHLSRVQPTGGFQPVNATLPLHNPKASTVPSEVKVSSGSKPFDMQSAAIVEEPPAWKPRVEENYSALQDSGLRKTQQHSSLPRYQTLIEPSDTARGGEQWRKSSTPAVSHRYQPSEEASRLSQRGSDPAMTTLQHEANSASLPPSWKRKGSDCTPAPFGAPYKSPPTVAPKPSASERKLSLERGWTPPSAQQPQGQPMGHQGPSPLAQPVRQWTPPAPEPPSGPRGGRNGAANPTEEKPSKTRAPANCYHCKEQIRGPYLMALDRYYCPDHFRCVKCEAPLGKQPFIAHENAVYCVDDFRNYVAPRCAKCKEPVTEQQLLALDKVYHPQCFVCTMCKEPMAEGSFRIGTDNMPYCDADWKAHFQVICGRCDFPIEADEQFIDALSKSYHVECFVCTTCHTKLEGKAFYLRNDQPYCRDHIQSH